MTGFLDKVNFSKIIKILVITAYPVGLLGMTVFAFPVGPIYLFPYRILIPIIWLFVIIWAVRERGNLILPFLRIKGFGLFLLIWLVYSILSINWAMDQISAVRQVIFLFYGFSLIFFSVAFFDSADDLSLVAKVWLVFLGFTYIIGVFETLTGHHLPGSGVSFTDYERFRYAPTAVFYNQNDFATYLSLSAPFLLSGLIFSKKRIIRASSLLSFGVLLYLLEATSSRSNYLALLLVILYFFFVAYSNQRSRRVLYGVISISLVVPMLFPKRILVLINSGLVYFQGLVLGISKGVGSLSIRLNLARNGFRFLVATWGFGVGAGNVERWMQTRAQFDIGFITNIHNWFLEVLVNYGIFIFAGYGIFYLGLMVKIATILRLHQNDQKMKVMGVALLGSLIGFFFASMSSSSIMALKPHWMIFAMALAYVNIGLNKTHRDGSKQDLKEKSS